VATPDDSEIVAINLADGSAAAPTPLVSSRPYGEVTIDPATRGQPSVLLLWSSMG